MTGRAVIVTGGCRGIGRVIATRFLELGAGVVVGCRHRPETLPRAAGAEASFVEVDVRQPAQLEALFGEAAESFGRLDVLVNNAGGAPPSEVATASPRFSAAIIDLNLTAPLNAAATAFRIMNAQDGGGCIINIASVSGTRPSPGSAAYGAAKAGLISLTKSLAAEWGPNVRVNAVVAGLVRTEQSHLFYGDEDGIAAVGATVPLGRMAEPSDIADACVFLASPLARYISGEALLVHGGGEKPAFLGAASGTHP